MKHRGPGLPLRVLLPTLAMGLIGAIPMLFVGSSQLRRACGDRLFGSREHLCSSRELWAALLSLPFWIQ